MNNDIINNIIKKMDNNFVENYEDMLKYKNNLDELLMKIGLKKFKSYNEFCIIFRNNTIDYLKKKNISNIEKIKNKIFSLIMNKTFRDKILESKNHEKKLQIFLNTEKNINDIIKNEHNENNI